MRGIILGLALGLSVAGGAAAMDAQGKYTVYGSGQVGCGQWTKQRTYGGTLTQQDQHWVLGYVTAYNRWVSKERSVLGDMEVNDIVAWMDEFCGQNPKESLTGAVESLILERVSAN